MKTELKSCKENLDLNVRKHEMFKNISRRNEDLYLAEIEELKELFDIQKVNTQMSQKEKDRIERKYNELLDKYNKLLKKMR